jgi:hypothetical protein
MRGVKIALAGGFATIALVLVVLLAQCPLTLAGTNSVPTRVEAELERGDVAGCQPAGTLPAGTEAIRIAIEARAVGPAVTVKALSGSRLLTQGHTPAGWGSAPTVTVAVGRLARVVTGARVCMDIGPAVEPFRVHGVSAGAPFAVTGLHGVILRMEYLRRDDASWWSQASSIAYHMGLGRAAGGTWVVFLAIALMLAVAVLGSRLALRELR